MEQPTLARLFVGQWLVNPAAGEISRGVETVRVEARTMRMLLCLAGAPGEVLSIDTLLIQVWPDVAVSPDSVYQTVASLRRLLGDDPRHPTYIATMPRMGYRMVAAVSPWTEAPTTSQSDKSADTDGEQKSSRPQNPANSGPRGARFPRFAFPWPVFLKIAAAVLSLAAVVVFLVWERPSHRETSTVTAPQPQRSIAVLPFLDLTEGMRQEEFADGMTEELIDRLSKISGLRVTPPTSSFYFKGKQIPVAEIARSLNVAYVLDGSVRKSGARIRVAARLIRADNGYIVWSETYDRPFHDILMVQDDIAGEVIKALKTSIDSKSGH